MTHTDLKLRHVRMSAALQIAHLKAKIQRLEELLGVHSEDLITTVHARAPESSHKPCNDNNGRELLSRHEGGRMGRVDSLGHRYL